MDDVTTIQRKPNIATDKAVAFSMRNLPCSSKERPMILWRRPKIFGSTSRSTPSGGENALHSHGGEDHAFIVLQGKATFTFGDGRTSVVGQYEGVMIPKNGLYKFVADEAENLVMLRVGGGVRTATGLNDLTPFGTPRTSCKDIVRGWRGQGRQCRQEWRNREGAHLCQGQVLRGRIDSAERDSLEDQPCRNYPLTPRKFAGMSEEQARTFPRRNVVGVELSDAQVAAMPR